MSYHKYLLINKTFTQLTKITSKKNNECFREYVEKDRCKKVVHTILDTDKTLYFNNLNTSSEGSDNLASKEELSD